ncbi:hypothetical protein [Planotetraspora phitsanulokensis]|uniref:hypothetical protein n=1 Tax=Planotetraspora phitsanulokensis TaxID=575192 RepID=UPI00194E8B11|nr:hypothetical protein [Planotetraspora phitsanulokensis]
MALAHVAVPHVLAVLAVVAHVLAVVAAVAHVLAVLAVVAAVTHVLTVVTPPLVTVVTAAVGFRLSLHQIRGRGGHALDGADHRRGVLRG